MKRYIYKEEVGANQSSNLLVGESPTKKIKPAKPEEKGPKQNYNLNQRGSTTPAVQGQRKTPTVHNRTPSVQQQQESELVEGSSTPST